MSGWQGRAACAALPPAVVGKYILEPVSPFDQVTGAAICYHCPVRAACLLDALTGNDTAGYRGGVSPKVRARQRRAIRLGASARAVVTQTLNEQPGPRRILNARTQDVRALRRGRFADATCV